MEQYFLFDVGGSAIKYAVCDEQLNLSHKGKYPFPMNSPKKNFYDALKNIYDTVAVPTVGIAISMPGMIDEEKGINYGSSMLQERNVDIVNELQEIFQLPVSVINDGYAAAEAELGYGNMKGINTGAVMVLGTGIGGAVIVDGKLHTGAHHGAGNFSFIYSDINQPENRNTQFSNYNGIQGLKQAINETAGLDDIDGLKAFQLIKEGNEDVKKGIDLFCDHLAYHIYNLQIILDMDRLLIGGGISNEPTFLSYVQQAIDRRWSTAMVKVAKPEVMICKYNNDSNLLGALYNWQQHYKH